MPAYPTPTPIGLDLAVIDYGMGNLRSVLRAFERVGGRPRLVVTPAEAAGADALVFPGQGAIVDCMTSLQATGFDDAIQAWIAADRPFLGVCLGLQALFEHSEEGDTKALGVFPGQVVRFRLDASYKIPHMGWNSVRWQNPAGEKSPAASTAGSQATIRPEGLPSEAPRSGAKEGDQFYFVHSYHAVTPDRSLIWGETEYGYPFTSAIRCGNCFATQFHPEKSQSKGLLIYRNFLELAQRVKIAAR